MNKSISPSRTYVAVCNNSYFDGYYFKKFVLPEYYIDYAFDALSLKFIRVDYPVPNNTEQAAWYFLNKLNFSACIEGVIAWEDYCDLSEQV